MKLLVIIALINMGTYLGISMAPTADHGIALEAEVVMQPEAPAEATVVAYHKQQPPVLAPIPKDQPGSEVWSQTYESPDLDSDRIALDADGDLMMPGSTFVVGENLDVRVSKYGRDGAVVWTKTFTTDSPSGSDDAFTVAIDDQGNVLGAAYEEEGYW